MRGNSTTSAAAAMGRRTATPRWPGPAVWVGLGAVVAVAGGVVLMAAKNRADRVDDHLAPGGQVRRVSGDRLKLKDGRDVEFAAIRLPYDHEPHAAKAREVLVKWVEDEGVRLRFDEFDRDENGRVVAYVYTNDTFINERLVRDGLAFVKLRDGNRQFADPLLAAQAAAQAEGKGLWQSVPLSAQGRLIGEPDRGTFHRPGCEKLGDASAGREEIDGVAEAFARGLAPCGKCRPLER